jgi:hypothetical protein
LKQQKSVNNNNNNNTDLNKFSKQLKIQIVFFLFDFFHSSNKINYNNTRYKYVAAVALLACLLAAAAAGWLPVPLPNNIHNKLQSKVKEIKKKQFFFLTDSLLR